MHPKAEEEVTMVEGMEAAGGDMITIPKVAAEATIEEDKERGEVEEVVAEGVKCREAGEMEVVGEAVTTRATTTMQVVIRVEEEEEVTEEEATKEDFRTLATTEEEAAAVVVAVTMTITTKMEAGIRREVGVEEAEGVEEEVAEEEEDKAEAGEGEEARILTKEDSLNSSSNMAGSTTTKLALIKADIILVEDTAWGIAAES